MKTGSERTKPEQKNEMEIASGKGTVRNHQELGSETAKGVRNPSLPSALSAATRQTGQKPVQRVLGRDRGVEPASPRARLSGGVRHDAVQRGQQQLRSSHSAHLAQLRPRLHAAAAGLEPGRAAKNRHRDQQSLCRSCPRSSRLGCRCPCSGQGCHRMSFNGVCQPKPCSASGGENRGAERRSVGAGGPSRPRAVLPAALPLQEPRGATRGRDAGTGSVTEGDTHRRVRKPQTPPSLML